jgi:drug/metabolite transporter (DMT)-like permease
VLVTGGVLVGLRDAFGSLGQRASVIKVLTVAGGTGALTVLTRLLGDLGVGPVPTYLVRTSLAAVIFVLAIPPRDVARSDAPRLFGRSLVVTAYFLLLIVATQRGNPVVAQTCVAATPLLVLGLESRRSGTRPPTRTLAAALVATLGVAVSLAASTGALGAVGR